jgi:F0F1-type ATP synthase assembly protein I
MEDSPKPPKRDHDASFIAQGFRFTALAFEFVGLLGIFGYVGYKVDEKYGVDPWGLLVGLLLGLGLGLFTMIRQLEKLNR